MQYYAIHRGYKIGIFNTWNECKKYTNGFKNSVFKKFNNKKDAQNFVEYGYNNNLDDKFKPDIYVYTDGACHNNGKSNAKAGYGIYFTDNDTRNKSKKIKGKQTNQVAELTAIIKAYKILKDEIDNNKKILFCTDSIYAIRCCTSYGQKCSDKNWENDIPNKKLVKKGYKLFYNKKNINFMHVKAHTNKKDIHSIGNQKADELANLAIGLISCPYN